jgi:hypothetical protein
VGGQGGVAQNASSVCEERCRIFISEVLKERAMNKKVMRIFKGVAAEATKHRPIMKTGGTSDVSRELPRA